MSKPKSEYRRVADDILFAAHEHATEYVHLNSLKQLILSIEAGSFICFGSLLTVFFTFDVQESGLSMM